MTTWNHRVIRKENAAGEPSFEIHEVYYDEAGAITNWMQNAVNPFGETLAELREEVLHFLTAFRKDVLEEALEDGKPHLRPAYEDQKINDGHYFELMDRSSVILHHCIDFVGNHPVVRKNARLHAIFEKAEAALAQLYQEAARLEYERSDV